MKIDIDSAKRHLAHLIDRVKSGDDVVITRRGQPVARLVGVERPVVPRKLGLLSGRIQVAEDFDAPLADDVWTAA